MQLTVIARTGLNNGPHTVLALRRPLGPLFGSTFGMQGVPTAALVASDSMGFCIWIRSRWHGPKLGGCPMQIGGQEQMLQNAGPGPK